MKKNYKKFRSGILNERKNFLNKIFSFIKIITSYESILSCMMENYFIGKFSSNNVCLT